MSPNSDQIACPSDECDHPLKSSYIIKLKEKLNAPIYHHYHTVDELKRELEKRKKKSQIK